MRDWIDSHVHLFSADDARWAAPSLREGEAPLALTGYRSAFAHRPPAGAVVVHFSKAPDASHVMAALAEARASGVPARGIVAADPREERLASWLEDSDVRGVRLYALESAPDLSASFWPWLYDRLRAHEQHLVLFGKGRALLDTLAALPDDVPVLIDHLGMPDVAEGPDGEAFATLRRLAAARNRDGAPVYVKGPGYRTSLDPAIAAPFIAAWGAALGHERILLGASDAPFFGPVPGKDGVLFRDAIDPVRILDYLRQICSLAGLDPRQALHGNAAALYGF